MPPRPASLPTLMEDLMARQVQLSELPSDRAYLSSRLVGARRAELAVFCKAWPVRKGLGFPKTAFTLDWKQQVLTGPQGVAMAFEAGGLVRFPPAVCAACPVGERRTTSARGRSISIQPDERLLWECRQRQWTALGRARLGERVAVEHTLGHVGGWQGERARYGGLRKNRFDVRRCAVVPPSTARRASLKIERRFDCLTGALDGSVSALLKRFFLASFGNERLGYTGLFPKFIYPGMPPGLIWRRW